MAGNECGGLNGVIEAREVCVLLSWAGGAALGEPPASCRVWVPRPVCLLGDVQFVTRPEEDNRVVWRHGVTCNEVAICASDSIGNL